MLLELLTVAVLFAAIAVAVYLNVKPPIKEKPLLPLYEGPPPLAKVTREVHTGTPASPHAEPFRGGANFECQMQEQATNGRVPVGGPIFIEECDGDYLPTMTQAQIDRALAAVDAAAKEMTDNWGEFAPKKKPAKKITKKRKPTIKKANKAPKSASRTKVRVGKSR
jgi:hypothetical protein